MYSNTLVSNFALLEWPKSDIGYLMKRFIENKDVTQFFMFENLMIFFLHGYASSLLHIIIHDLQLNFKKISLMML